MDDDKFQIFVQDRYKPQMAFYSEASKKNKVLYKRYQLMLIILSALTPVLAAIKTSYNETYLSLTVILVSSVVAILNTVLKTFNYHELWITYRSTLEKLKPEIHYYNFNVGPYAETGINKEILFVSRIEAILGGENNQWPPLKDLNKMKSK